MILDFNFTIKAKLKELEHTAQNLTEAVSSLMVMIYLSG